MITRITGKDNKTLKLIKSLKKRNNRVETGLYVAEGRRISEEAFKYIPDSIFCVVMTEDFFCREAAIAERAQELCNKVYVVSGQAFADIADTDTPQGILVVAEMPGKDFVPDADAHNIVVLDGVSEPGNMGTVIRTAEALGFDGIYLTKGCADIYSLKTVRSTMGSVFRMKFRVNCNVEDIKELQKQGFSIVSTTPGGDICLEKMQVPEKSAVVIGNEAHGVCDDILAISDMKVRISMDGLAESLNAAVAAGIALHWIKNCGK